MDWPARTPASCKDAAGEVLQCNVTASSAEGGWAGLCIATATPTTGSGA